jgi:surface carbohydrate biosynthesis protein (TIGR04326 family)
LLPSVEEQLKRRHSGEVILGRKASLSVRKQARQTYLSIAAGLATVPAANGKSLRRTLARPDQASRWWYHLLSFKDCEVDPTFERIIALFTIIEVARNRGIHEIVLVGGPIEITLVLEQAFRVRSFFMSRQRLTVSCAKSLVSRLAYGARVAYICWLTRIYRAPPSVKKIDVAFSGFWSWSVGIDETSGTVVDSYYGDLPKAIVSNGDVSVGWLAWLETAPPAARKYDLARAARAAREQRSVVILQSMLGYRDVLRAIVDFSPLMAVVKFWKRPEFRRAFQTDGLNLFHLFKRVLLSSALDASIPLGDLVALATERACCRLQPAATFSFLEHYPYARAHYEGVKRANPGTLNYAVQHARYSSEKTFFFLDPELEFRGNPDGCPVPHPDYVFAMGAFSRQLFLECGYPPDRVVVTGSPRYERVTIGDLLERETSGPKKEIRLLLVGGVAVRPDLEMIDAACDVAKTVSELAVSLRKHPLSQIERFTEFDRYRDQVRITTSRLDQDLEDADIILCSYSTVAEDAFLRGRPVWQWLSLGVNGSALSEVVSIPCVWSVESLREAIACYRANPSRYASDEATRSLVLSRLFHKVDGQSANRVAVFAGHALKQPVPAQL